MKNLGIVGLLLIVSSIALLIPYSMLTAMFEYPDILRQDTATILTKFHEQGSGLIWTWFTFAIVGLPLIPAFVILGRKLEMHSSWIRVATTVGILGLVVQVIGLLRWTFVVPVLADVFVNSKDMSMQSAALVAFKTIHQYGGVVLGEHLGQLFTIAWTVLMSYQLRKTSLFPSWMMWFGFGSSFIYLFAQAELFATVIADIPVIDAAGFAGSTLWLIWMVCTGVYLMRNAHIHESVNKLSEVKAHVEGGKLFSGLPVY